MVSLSFWEKTLRSTKHSMYQPKKIEKDNGKTITYKIKFIDSVRFVSSLLSNLDDNLNEGLH